MPRIPSGMRKTARGTYESRFTIDGKRYSVYGKSVRECREKEQARRREITEGRYRAGKAPSLDEYFRQWDTSRIGTMRDSTIRTERYIYRLVAGVRLSDGKTLGELRLGELERRHICEAQLTLRKSYSASSVNRGISVLRAVLESALEERRIDWNPAKGVRMLKSDKKPPRETIHRALSLEETEGFFRAAERLGSWYLNLYSFLLNTGCRFGEAGALRASDIADEMIRIERTLTRTVDGHLVIGSDTKTGHSARLIPARREALAAVQGQQRQNVREFGRPDGTQQTVFCAKRGGLLGARCVKKDIDRICLAAGIERFSSHAFRDTFATRAVESGMQPKTLQEILGHADIGITMNLYAHVMEDTKRIQMTAVEVMRGTDSGKAEQISTQGLTKE